MNLNHNTLAGFDFSSVISAASGALKDNLPNLVQAGIQKRMAEINAKRAEKMRAAQDRQAAALTPPEPVYLPATVRAPAPAAAGQMAFFQSLPAWVIPAVIAAVVAFLKLRNKKK